MLHSGYDDFPKKPFAGDKQVTARKENSLAGAVVITDGYTGLGITRSLGRRGIPVWVVGQRFSVAAVSRYAHRTLPMKGRDESEQADFLVEVARRNHLQNWTLFPDSDKGAALIARNGHKLGGHYRITVPGWDILKWAFDKRLTYRLADNANVKHPKTFYPQDRNDAENIESAFPMVVKPAHHQGGDLFSIGRPWKAENRKELLAMYDKARSMAGASVIMIQEMIPGGNNTQFSFAALCRDGKVLAKSFVERKRLLPAEFGSGTFVETIEKPEIEAPAVRWLGQAKYTGLVEIDLKFDERDGEYKILDVNPRAWGWIALCARAGVDFPYLMWRMAQGENISPACTKPGFRWVRTSHDLIAAARAARDGGLTVREYLASIYNTGHEMYALDDPLPAIAEIPFILELILNKMQGR